MADTQLTDCDIFPWQESLWRDLVAAVQSDRLAHGLLFSGPAGTGKEVLARNLAKMLLCEQPAGAQAACGQCQSCGLFAAGNHPDFLDLRSGGEELISIDLVRQLRATLELGAHFSGYRIALISPADAMNTAASNALLKTLEEPVPGTILILVTSLPSMLSQTITSRCQHRLCTRPDPDMALRWLQQQGADSNAGAALAVAGGAPLAALELSRSGLLEVRAEVFRLWIAVAASKKNPVELAQAWKDQPLEQLLLWMTTWTMDMIRLYYGATDRELANPDLASRLNAEMQRLDLKKLFKFYDRLLQASARNRTQVNRTLMLEELLLEWCLLGRCG